MNKISDAELEIMKILWRENKPLSSVDICTELQESKSWDKSTIRTLIKRLENKGVILSEKHRTYFYQPNITQEQYTEKQSKSFLEKFYGGSAMQFVTALCSNGKITENEILELKNFFNME